MTLKPGLLSLALAAALCLSFPAAANTASNADTPERWVINLKNAEIADFIEQVAQISGQTFVVDPRVKGQVSVISQASLSLSEVYQLFLSVMASHGYTVIAQGEQARIVPNAEAKSEASTLRGNEAMETRLLVVQHAPVADLIPLIRPLVPQHGHLAAVTSANALIVTDRAANIERIARLLEQVDHQGEHDYSVINLQHAWVEDAAKVLENALPRGQSKGSGSTQIIADSRSNRLILLGPDKARARLVRLAQSLDNPSQRSANTRVIRLRHNDAKSLAETLGEFSEQLKESSGESSKSRQLMIRADESLNALILLAEPDMLSTLEGIVQQLDVPRAQVLVEAAIVEISGDISDAIGVQWAIDARGDKGGLGGVNFSNTGLSVGTVIGAIANDKLPDNLSLPDGAIVGVGSDNFGALITALSANSKSNLLSTPSLLTLDNQKAEILVGQNVPFQTGSYTTDAAGANNPFTTIERKDIGVTLKVTPHINEGGALRLEIDQEISSIAPSADLNAQAVDLVTNKRSIKSTILAGDGQIVVLGGLLQDDVTQSDSKVPLLGDIPLLGRLFRSSRESHVKRNLMVFLRPTVVRDSNGLAALAEQKYGSIRLYGGDQPAGRHNLLPERAERLFQQGQPIDLRP